jgi:isoquinoline 1-oxidoreductase beta subunit
MTTQAEPEPASLPDACITRRAVLIASGGFAAGLCLGIESPLAAPAAAGRFGPAQLSAYLEIGADNEIHIVTPDLEIGQGIYTSLPLILADELGADWERVKVRQSWADEHFINPMKGIQATGRSMSVRGQYELLRKLGATARTMLCEAAARHWGVAAAECTTERSYVVHRSGKRRLAFGALVAAASELPVPENPALRPDGELAHLGRDVPRKDVPDKVTGAAVFGVDVKLPGMLVATVKASPVFGASIEELNDARAKALPGVRAVVRLPGAVAAVADNWWQAWNAVRAVDVRFASGPNDAVSSAELDRALQASLEAPGVVGTERGDVQPASGARQLEADYAVPYLAHATMEPMNCTARMTEQGCELWAPSQGPIRLRDEVAQALGLPKDKVHVYRTFGGGGFGRRWQPDFGIQAALIARELPGRPVKLIWSRGEDMQQDFYRPAARLRATASIDAAGKLATLDLKLACASIWEWGKPGRLQGKADPLAIGGLSDTPYAFPAYRVRWVSTPTHVPVGVWRSVAHSHNGFFLECVLDEIAAAAGRDPLELRLELLSWHPRLQKLLRLVAERAGWGRPLPKGEGLGMAFMEDQGSAVAQVAHVRIVDGRLRVLKVCCAIDCGKALQPQMIAMQMESGIIFGLTAAFHGEIRIAAGGVRESNFHDYRLLTLAETPEIVVDVVEGGLPLGGVGEPGVPPIAPAVANAIYAATGQRIRSLPLSRHGLV